MMADRPNIIYVHSHDTGRYVQPYGHQVLTPNIQLLADQGITFRRAFCAAPTCSGSRAALLTGQHCHNNGMTGLAHRGWTLNDYSQHLVHPLKAAGYNTILVGEQHISLDPNVIGYDEVIPLSDNYAKRVAPSALDALRRTSEPFFMSVGFFETHRDFAAPTSVRDSLYSLPPENLPDTRETRSDMAAFKESVRSLDQGIGALLNGLHDSGLADRTLVICTTDHGLAFPKAKATLLDGGIGVMMLMRGPNGFSGGRVIDSMVSHLDIYPTVCELAGIPPPGYVQGRSLMPLVGDELTSLHEELFSEVTYHAAYEPQRAVRTNRWKYIRRFDDRKHPVLANCDDSATKNLLIEKGWGKSEVDREQLFDLFLDPVEQRNLAGDPSSADVLVDMRSRLDRWMEETSDPIRLGPVPPPPGARINDPDQVSPDEPLTLIAD
jgi:arylsulfatase A-like enzyme